MRACLPAEHSCDKMGVREQHGGGQHGAPGPGGQAEPLRLPAGEG